MKKKFPVHDFFHLSHNNMTKKQFVNDAVKNMTAEQYELLRKESISPSDLSKHIKYSNSIVLSNIMQSIFETNEEFFGYEKDAFFYTGITTDLDLSITANYKSDQHDGFIIEVTALFLNLIGDIAISYGHYHEWNLRKESGEDNLGFDPDFFNSLDLITTNLIVFFRTKDLHDNPICLDSYTNTVKKKYGKTLQDKYSIYTNMLSFMLSHEISHHIFGHTDNNSAWLGELKETEIWRKFILKLSSFSSYPVEEASADFLALNFYLGFFSERPCSKLEKYTAYTALLPIMLSMYVADIMFCFCTNFDKGREFKINNIFDLEKTNLRTNLLFENFKAITGETSEFTDLLKSLEEFNLFFNLMLQRNINNTVKLEKIINDHKPLFEGI